MWCCLNCLQEFIHSCLGLSQLYLEMPRIWGSSRCQRDALPAHQKFSKWGIVIGVGITMPQPKRPFTLKGQGQGQGSNAIARKIMGLWNLLLPNLWGLESPVDPSVGLPACPETEKNIVTHFQFRNHNISVSTIWKWVTIFFFTFWTHREPHRGVCGAPSPHTETEVGSGNSTALGYSYSPKIRLGACNWFEHQNSLIGRL